MTSQLKAKLLQHFAGKKANGGFTLIELLVVIIIIGILSAIALPSFLNQANKAKQSEAKTYVGSINRAQQAYYMENASFAPDANFGQLGLGISQSTDSYSYGLIDGVVNAQDKYDYTGAEATPVDVALKLYAGAVKVATQGSGANTEATTLAVLCEALEPAVSTSGLKGGSAANAGDTQLDKYFTGVNDAAAATLAPDCLDTAMKKL
ncbi:MAG: type IV pilin-like G/H family protein [Cyanobacteria bacterium J06581_3]